MKPKDQNATILQKGTRLVDVLKAIGGNDIEYISWRILFTLDEEQCDEFFGACQYKEGVIIPLDGDIYSLEDEICAYMVWKDDEGNDCLVVREETEVIRG